jgi:hypothetical protein
MTTVYLRRAQILEAVISAGDGASSFRPHGMQKPAPGGRGLSIG